MHDESVELFVGVPSHWRDDVETRVAASEDPFVQFVWQNFARFSEVINRFLLKQPLWRRPRFIMRALYFAWADFGNPQTIPMREAFPLEWFTVQVARARN